MSEAKKYAVIEHYPEGGKWTHTYASLEEANWGMEDLRDAHGGRTYELIEY